MNFDHLVQMMNLKFLPDLPEFPERKVACGDPAANSLKGEKKFPSFILLVVARRLCGILNKLLLIINNNGNLQGHFHKVLILFGLNILGPFSLL